MWVPFYVLPFPVSVFCFLCEQCLVFTFHPSSSSLTYKARSFSHCCIVWVPPLVSDSNSSCCLHEGPKYNDACWLDDTQLCAVHFSFIENKIIKIYVFINMAVLFGTHWHSKVFFTPYRLGHSRINEIKLICCSLGHSCTIAVLCHLLLILALVLFQVIVARRYIATAETNLRAVEELHPRSCRLPRTIGKASQTDGRTDMDRPVRCSVTLELEVTVPLNGSNSVYQKFLG
jgi:hypothetical protein